MLADPLVVTFLGGTTDPPRPVPGVGMLSRPMGCPMPELLKKGEGRDTLPPGSAS